MNPVRERIADLIGFAPVSEAPQVEKLDSQDADGCQRTLLRYSAPDHEWIEAFLFEPSGKTPSGGALVLHQHNSEWSIGKREVAGLAGDSMQAFGPALARRGVVVLAPDTIGFESRVHAAAGASGDEWLQYYNQMAHRLVQGDLLMRKMLSDWQAAVSVLQAAIPDGSPIGVVGHSMGGSVALFLGALDARIDFTVSSGAVGAFRRKLARGLGLEMALVIPGFASHLDIDDVMRCIAPRQLLVVSADSDPASEDAADLVEWVRPSFEGLDGGQRLHHIRAAGGHGLDQQRFDAIVDWVTARCETR